jgi:hypothetical protein
LKFTVLTLLMYRTGLRTVALAYAAPEQFRNIKARRVEHFNLGGIACGKIQDIMEGRPVPSRR